MRVQKNKSKQLHGHWSKALKIFGGGEARLKLNFGDIIISVIVSALESSITSILLVCKWHRQKISLFKLKAITQNLWRLQQQFTSASEYQVNSTCKLHKF